jgi:hypothetical protein
LQRLLYILDDNVTSNFCDAKVVEMYSEVKKDKKKHFLLVLDDVA